MTNLDAALRLTKRLRRGARDVARLLERDGTRYARRAGESLHLVARPWYRAPGVAVALGLLGAAAVAGLLLAPQWIPTREGGDESA